MLCLFIWNWSVTFIHFYCCYWVCNSELKPKFTQSVNFGRHLTEILYPFEISYQISIHTLPYQYLSFRNFTLPKFSFEKSYLTKIFFSEMPRNFTIIKVSVNRLYVKIVNVTLRKLRWRQLAPAVDERRKTKTKQWLATTKEASHWTYTRMNSKLWP